MAGTSIFNELEIKTTAGILARSKTIYDDTQQKNQQTINEELYEATKKQLMTDEEYEALTDSEIDESTMYMTYEDEL